MPSTLKLSANANANSSKLTLLGSRKVLQIGDLYPLDENLEANNPKNRFLEAWEKGKLGHVSSQLNSFFSLP